MRRILWWAIKFKLKLFWISKKKALSQYWIMCIVISKMNTDKRAICNSHLYHSLCCHFYHQHVKEYNMRSQNQKIWFLRIVLLLKLNIKVGYVYSSSSSRGGFLSSSLWSRIKTFSGLKCWNRCQIAKDWEDIRAENQRKHTFFRIRATITIANRCISQSLGDPAVLTSCHAHNVLRVHQYYFS